MAAGEGTRMRSSTPKMLHPVCGRPMVAWPIIAARAAGAGRVAAIVSPGRDLSAGLPEGVETVVQPQADGTGGAIRAALPLIEEAETVLVLSGDVPLISERTIADLLQAHEGSQAAATMLTIELGDPGSYGRVVRDVDGWVERVVEAKAAGDAEAWQLEIGEINAGTYAFDAAPLAAALRGLSNDNAQREYYLPDVFPALREAGHPVAAHRADDLAVTMGINNRVDLAAVEAEARRRLLEAHMLAGATIVDPASTWIDAAVEIAADARIEPGTTLRGATKVGAGAVVEDGVKAGTFVEIKNSQVGEGAKVPHLAYVGDADVGHGSNLDDATIT